ncbi:hypothetical protein OIE68_04090 [Nocardia vinacea]|uniref:hypothetical protein n=1 Tax=Nocardia vinacea TaxID=96468 RepID=UPI002E15600D|nr:hypothetical protein OIE68_04090 [Nocardia vinacea]
MGESVYEGNAGRKNAEPSLFAAGSVAWVSAHVLVNSLRAKLRPVMACLDSGFVRFGR